MGRILTVEELELCMMSKFQEYDLATGHAQASALKSMVLPSIDPWCSRLYCLNSILPMIDQTFWVWCAAQVCWVVRQKKRASGTRKESSTQLI